MTRTASPSIAEQDGPRGYFGALTMEVDVTEGAGLAVTVCASLAEWRAGIEFGIAHAFEKTAARTCVEVRVTEGRGFAVDTSQALMAWLAARGFYECLGVDPEAFVHLDRVTGQVSFRK